MERLDPKLDVVFKLLFTREPALLIDMLQGILARSIEDMMLPLAAGLVFSSRRMRPN